MAQTNALETDASDIVGLPLALFERHRRDYPDHDFRSLQVTLALRRTGLRLDAMVARWFAPVGLTPPKFNLLVTLWACGDEPLALSEISRYLLTTPTNVTGLADRLEHDGYVVRQNHPTDRRSKLVALTAKGQQLLQRVMPGYFERIGRAMSTFTHEERETLALLLAKFDRAFASLEER